MHRIERSIRRIYRCPECGEVRIFVRTGLVCPAGCGKIVSVPPELRRRLVKRRPARYADPLTAPQRPRVFMIDGLQGFFRLAPRGREASATPARVDGRLRYFVPAEEGPGGGGQKPGLD